MKKITLLFAVLLACMFPAMAQSVNEPDVDLSVAATGASDYVLVADSLLIETIAENADPLVSTNESPVVESPDSIAAETNDSTVLVAEESAPVNDAALTEGDSTMIASDSVEPLPADSGDYIAMDYVPNPFKDNWELSIAGGVAFLFNGMGHIEETMSAPIVGGKRAFLDAIGGLAEIAATKWMSPYLGARVGWTTGYLPFHHALEHKAESPIGVWDNYIHVDVLWDWTTQFGGYNPNRIYDAVPYVHMGCVVNPVCNAGVGGGIGFLSRFHVADHWLVNIDLRGTATTARKYGLESGIALDVTALVGVSYRFDNVGWKKEVENPYKSTLEDLRAANEELDQKRAQVEQENEKLDNSLTQREQERKELAQLVAAITKDTTFYGVPDTMEMTVYYAINSADLSAHEKAHMNTYLRLITLNDPNYMHIYKVVGSADAGTGAREVNESLCRRRAETIKNVLIESGVDPENITTEIEVIETGDAQMARASHVVIYPVEKPKVVIPDTVNLDVDDED